MKATYHVHCDYCDGNASARDMAKAAAEAGYASLGFSSHSPVPGDRFKANMRSSDLEDYAAEIRGIAREWAGRGLEILVGLELEWLPWAKTVGDGRRPSGGLDFAIGSLHLVDLGNGLFAVDEPQEAFDRRAASQIGDCRRVWKAYYAELCELITAGGFDILGHFDIVTKNNRGERHFDSGEAAYRAAALEAARLLAGKGIVAELNYGGMSRGKTDAPYPAPFILRELRELGVPITLSADAHAPEHLGPRCEAYREAAREAARAAGYRSVVALSGGKWIEMGLDEA